MVLTTAFSYSGIKSEAKSSKKIYMVVGEKQNIKNALSFQYSEKINSIKTASKKVLSVSKTGIVKAKKKGKTTLTVSSNAKSYQCKVIVENVALSTKATSMLINEKKKIKLTGASAKVKWYSSKKGVASVNKKGVVTGKKSGKAMVTAKYRGRKFTSEITVQTIEERKIANTKDFYFRCIHQYLWIGGPSVNLSYKVTPSTLKPSDISWTSSDKEVVVVNDGVLTPKGGGTATITVKYKDGEAKMSVTVGTKAQKYADVEMVAHRGGNAGPENTIPAYEEAVKAGYSYGECDVSWTSDNVPVLLHDSTIRRTSSCTQLLPINTITFEKARSYDYGITYNDDFINTKIPRFDEFIAFCKKSGMTPYIEIKGSTYREQTMLLAQIVKSYDMEDKVEWVSFSKDSLESVLEVSPTASVGYLAYSLSDNDIEEALSLKTDKNTVTINPEYDEYSLELLRSIGNSGLKFKVWTIDGKAAMQKMLSYGAVGITTNQTFVPTGKSVFHNN